MKLFTIRSLALLFIDLSLLLLTACAAGGVQSLRIPRQVLVCPVVWNQQSQD